MHESKIRLNIKAVFSLVLRHPVDAWCSSVTTRFCLCTSKTTTKSNHGPEFDYMRWHKRQGRALLAKRLVGELHLLRCLSWWAAFKATDASINTHGVNNALSPDRPPSGWTAVTSGWKHRDAIVPEDRRAESLPHLSASFCYSTVDKQTRHKPSFVNGAEKWLQTAHQALLSSKQPWSWDLWARELFEAKFRLLPLQKQCQAS